jgi:hypothetical protein
MAVANSAAVAANSAAVAANAAAVAANSAAIATSIMSISDIISVKFEIGMSESRLERVVKKAENAMGIEDGGLDELFAETPGGGPSQSEDHAHNTIVNVKIGANELQFRENDDPAELKRMFSVVARSAQRIVKASQTQG